MTSLFPRPNRRFTRFALRAIALPLLALSLASCAKQEAPEEAEALDLEQASRIFAFPGGAPKAVDPEEVLITVNDEPIRRRELANEVVKILMSQPVRQLTPEQAARLRAQAEMAASEILINRKLILDKARMQEVQVPEEEVNGEMDRLKSQLKEGETLDGLLERMQATESSLRMSIRDNLMFQKMLKLQTTNLPEVSEEQVAKAYEGEKARLQQPATIELEHLFLEIKPDAEPARKQERKEELESLRAQVLDGGDWAKLATGFSECPISSKKNGVLGAVDPMRLGAAFPGLELDVMTLSSNEVSKVVASGKGYHLFRAGARTEARQLTLEETGPQIKTLLTRQREQEAVTAYIRGLRESAEVVYSDAVKPVAPGGKQPPQGDGKPDGS